MSTTENEIDARLRQAYRIILLLSATTVALLLVSSFLLWMRPNPEDTSNQMIADPEIRELAVRELVVRSQGIWDSFSDSDVGRVLQTGIKNRDLGGWSVTSNKYGIREDHFELTKPPDTVRVVILGDSFVFGHGIDAEDRVGAQLEEFLHQRSIRKDLTIECLNIGMETWNIRAECEFIRRQLGELRPDLVVQIVVRNDLDDNPGIRGFGAWSGFSDFYRERADGLLAAHYPLWYLGASQSSWLPFGFDYESRIRFQEASDLLKRFSNEVERMGGEYLLLTRWPELQSVAQKLLVHQLKKEQVAHLPNDFIKDSRYRNSEEDSHWNRAGNQMVAKMVYGLILARGLLSELELEIWPEATDIAAELAGKGLAQAEGSYSSGLRSRFKRISPKIQFPEPDKITASQVHGGIDIEGQVTPYASIILRRSGNRLVVSGQCLERPELDGETLEVLVDESLVHTIELRAGQPVRFESDLPTSTEDLEYVSVRFRASDYVYDVEKIQHCIVFRLDSVSIEP